MRHAFIALRKEDEDPFQSRMSLVPCEEYFDFISSWSWSIWSTLRDKYAHFNVSGNGLTDQPWSSTSSVTSDASSILHYDVPLRHNGSPVRLHIPSWIVSYCCEIIWWGPYFDPFPGIVPADHLHFQKEIAFFNNLDPNQGLSSMMKTLCSQVSDI